MTKDEAMKVLMERAKGDPEATAMGIVMAQLLSDLGAIRESLAELVRRTAP